MGSPWINKYSPNTLNEVVGHISEKELLKALIRNYKKGSKLIFLYGGTGNGKTSSVYALAKDEGLEVVEVNASDIRKAAALESLLGSAINQGSLFGSSKIILIDEAEGLSGVYDRGASPTILKLASESKYPIIIIANDAYNNKLKALRKKSDLIEFKELSYEEVKKILEKISLKEQLQISNEALNHIARISGGDVRAAINDLQSLGKNITLEDALTLSERNTSKKLEDGLRIIYKSKNPQIALRALDEVDIDLDKIFLWIEENTPLEYLNPEDLEKAMDNIADADKFYGRIRRWQYYRFYVYCYALLTAGISLSKQNKYSHNVDYSQGSRILKIWIANRANMKKKSIASKLANITHTSNKVALAQIPYYKAMFKHGKGSSIAELLELNNEEIDWLKK
ncbi:MAG: replication factor C large subunit [Candidatus Woesearchaeota archaeon]